MVVVRLQWNLLSAFRSSERWTFNSFVTTFPREFLLLEHSIILSQCTISAANNMRPDHVMVLFNLAVCIDAEADWFAHQQNFALASWHCARRHLPYPVCCCVLDECGKDLVSCNCFQVLGLQDIWRVESTFMG